MAKAKAKRTGPGAHVPGTKAFNKAVKALKGGGQLTDKEYATLKRLQAKKKAAPRGRGKR